MLSATGRMEAKTILVTIEVITSTYNINKLAASPQHWHDQCCYAWIYRYQISNTLEEHNVHTSIISMIHTRTCTNSQLRHSDDANDDYEHVNRT